MNNDSFYTKRPSFIQRLLKALNQERFPFLFTLVSSMVVSGVVIQKIPSVYEANSELLIEYPRSTEQLSGIDSQTGVGRLDAVGERVNPIKNQVALLKSRSIFEGALKKLNLSPEEAPSSLLEVNNPSGTDLIQVNYRSKEPQLAVDVLQEVVNFYKEANLKINREKGLSARQFLEKRLPLLQSQLNKARQELKQFQQENRYIGSSAELESFTESLIALEEKVKTTQAKFSATTQKINVLKRQIPNNFLEEKNSVGLSQDPGYQKLQENLIEIEAKLAELQTRFTDADPNIIAAKEKRDRLLNLLNDYSQKVIGDDTGIIRTTPVDPLRQRQIEQLLQLEAENAFLSAQLKQESQQLSQLQNRYYKLPELIKVYNRLQTTLNTKLEEYKTFTRQYAASQIAEQQEISNIRIVEPALLQPDPVSPKRKLLWALAFAGSNVLAFAVVWYRFSSKNSISSIAQLQEILPLPILSVIPWSGNGRLSGLQDRDDPALANSYYVLQAHLQMLPTDRKAIAVCSWLHEEGRTSVAVNLALIEADLGKRVLLISTDTSFAIGTKKLSVTHSIGSEEDSSDLTTASELKFDILSNSNISAKEWLLLLEQKRKQYDLVIIDSPPVIYNSEAALIASMSDGVLWVACPERLDRKQAEAATERLQTWSQQLLGMAIIGVSSDQVNYLSTDNTYRQMEFT